MLLDKKDHEKVISGIGYVRRWRGEVEDDR
jgi:hypothetical protein